MNVHIDNKYIINKIMVHFIILGGCVSSPEHQKIFSSGTLIELHALLWILNFFSMIYVIIDECHFSGDGISNMLLSFILLGVL